MHHATHVICCPEGGAEVIRVNILLTSILVACALGIVSSQHEARKLFVDLGKAQEFARQLAVEWDQLQLEQLAWAKHPRVETVAVNRLNMRMPDSSRVQVIPLPDPARPQSETASSRP